jgi:hypothetical protein
VFIQQVETFYDGMVQRVLQAFGDLEQEAASIGQAEYVASEMVFVLLPVYLSRLGASAAQIRPATQPDSRFSLSCLASVPFLPLCPGTPPIAPSSEVCCARKDQRRYRNHFPAENGPLHGVGFVAGGAAPGSLCVWGAGEAAECPA